MSKGKGVIYILIFVAFTMCPWVLSLLFVGLSRETIAEKRDLAELPTLTFESYPTYFSDLESYINDHIPFRSKLISVNNYTDYYVFGDSPSKDVIIGKNGYMFYSLTMPDYQRNNLYSEKELEEIKEKIEDTKAYFDELGVDFIIYIAPNKPSIYARYMPEYIKREEGKSRTEQVVDYLRSTSNVNIVWPEEKLIECAERYPEENLYLKLDTHWNYLGGFFGAQELFKAMGMDEDDFSIVTLSKMNEPDFFWGGYDMPQLMGLSKRISVDTNYTLDGYTTSNAEYSGDVRNNLDDFQTFIRIKSDAKDKRKLYFSRDSFGEALTPYLAGRFSDIYSEHHYILSKKHIEQEKPDIFVYEIVEREGLRDIDISIWE